jgi:hypothetical protein
MPFKLVPAVLAAVALASVHPAAAAAPAKAKPACEEGKVFVRGACVVACPKEGPFKADTCECPPGFGKVFFGNGAGECKPLICPTTGEFSAARDCQCPQGFKKKAGHKGNMKCAATKA